MKRSLSSLRSAVRFAVVAVVLALTATASRPASAAEILGQHVVQRGETLYCIGRAYGVLPTAIAQANGIPRPYILYPGQVLNIPNVRWARVPLGPVCARQFSTAGGVTTFGAATAVAPTSPPAVIIIVVTNTPGPAVAPQCKSQEFFDPLLNRCRFDPSLPQASETPTAILNLFLPPTSTPKPCIPPEFYDPFLNRCRLPDPTFTPTPRR